MLNAAMFSSETAEWATPQAFYDELNREFGFTLDPCATPQNAKCAKFYTKEQDGLAQSWQGERVFCNPPYGRDLRKWVEKAHREARGGRSLLCSFPPAPIRRTSTIISTASTRFVLFAGGSTSTRARQGHRSRRW